MKEKVGLWIDHRKAVMVIVTEKGEESKTIKSNVEKQLRPSGGLRSNAPHGPQEAPPDDLRERGFTGHLNAYFDKVVSCVRDAESILIFGPGEAKGELKKRIERTRPGACIQDVETCDKMTDGEIAAKVRRYFSGPAGSRGRRSGSPGG